MATVLRPIKKTKTTPTLSANALGILHSKRNSFEQKHQRRVKILFDTGCGATVGPDEAEEGKLENNIQEEQKGISDICLENMADIKTSVAKAWQNTCTYANAVRHD